MSRFINRYIAADIQENEAKAGLILCRIGYQEKVTAQPVLACGGDQQ
jgi:hypothetical protein